jgi:hypothetical protein
MSEWWSLVERLRAAGWLVVIKAMPPQASFVLEGTYSELNPTPDRLVGQGQVACELKWMGEGIRHPVFALANSPDEAVLAVVRKIGSSAV